MLRSLIKFNVFYGLELMFKTDAKHVLNETRDDYIVISLRYKTVYIRYLCEIFQYDNYYQIYEIKLKGMTNVYTSEHF